MVDYSYYKTMYKGVEMETEVFDKLALISFDLINYLTNNAEETENIKKAQCCQIEFLYNNGGINAINGKDSSQYVSESIGSYSYSKNSNARNTIQYVNGLPLAPMLKIYLGKTKGGALINVG